MEGIFRTSGRKIRLIFCIALSMLLLLLMFQALAAQEEEGAPPDFSGSSKTVDKSTALPGNQLLYTVVISNSGDQPAAQVEMTDSLVPELSYVDDSLYVTGGGLYGESAGVITWTGAVNNGTEIVISFGATLTETAVAGTVITNTAVLSYAGGSLDLEVSTDVISDTGKTIYLPFIGKSLASVYLYQIGRPNSLNQWSINWSVSDPIGVTGYQIEEDTDPAFPNPNAYATDQSTLSLDLEHPVGNINTYFYRVRSVSDNGLGPWSFTRAIIVNYRDDFTNPGTGWTMRRQDTDDTANQWRYENGEWVHEMDSSWDYLITGPMAVIPDPPYRLEMRARHVEPGNLNSYGMVFGGDWNAQDGCPSADFTTCFNQYYRLNVIWFGDANSTLRAVVKRIDYHDADNNHGRGVTIIGATDVPTIGPSGSFQVWAVEVYPNGTIMVFINGNLVGQTTDTNYIDRPYFGTFSATDEYAGLEAHFDWFKVTVLP